MRSTGVRLGRKTLCREDFDRVKRGKMFGRHCLRINALPLCAKDIVYVSED